MTKSRRGARQAGRNGYFAKSINYSDCETSIKPVLRLNGTARMRGDYPVTLIKVLHVDRYPLPSIEELFARLHRGKESSKLNLTTAYMQLELADELQPPTYTNTHRDHIFSCLVFVLSPAPLMSVQKTME
ncbi:Uncharacterized protein K02A2.6 [Eumeta japonica]|uniref:Uncharacterized protein K02A2.6 n=1 Tax=Eumeta variegata TaxID=151549 RepID=A0A4C1U0W9_EUMVA|nr:Uncharacterized protein K02A2.6 [Eumeta japonica]